MRFWRFIKDELRKVKENQESQQEKTKEDQSSEQPNEEQSEEQGSEQPNEEQSEEQGSGQPNEEQSEEQGSEQPNEEQSEEQGSEQPNEEQSEEQGSEQPNEEQSEEQGSDQQTEEKSQEQGSEQQTKEQSQEQGSEQQTKEQSQEQSSKQPTGDQSQEEVSEQQTEEQSQEEVSDQQTKEQSQGQGSEQQTEEQSEEEVSEQPNDEQVQDTTTDINRDERKEQLQQLRDKLLEYAKKKMEQEELEKQNLQKSHLSKQTGETEETEEEKYPLSEHANQFLEQLQDLPSFKDRERGPGYAIDTEGYTELPDSLVRTLITKFLNQRFCKHRTDLNVRSNSLKKAKGFYKWEVKDVITHLETHQITKVFDDKYGYEYDNGKNENVPLSFYFDMSGSMSKYTNMLAVIAIELLKKDVKVLIGFNERVNVQIESIKKNMDVKELADLLQTAGYGTWSSKNDKEKLKKDARVSFRFIDKNLDNYLLSKKAEKCVVFADFDPLSEVVNLSHSIDVYWFCFEEDFSKRDLSNFNGFIYQVRNAKDIASGLVKVNENRFEALCYIENPKIFQKN